MMPRGAVRLNSISIPEATYVIDMIGPIKPVAKMASVNAFVSGLPGNSDAGKIPASTNNEWAPIRKKKAAYIQRIMVSILIM